MVSLSSRRLGFGSLFFLAIVSTSLRGYLGAFAWRYILVIGPRRDMPYAARPRPFIVAYTVFSGAICGGSIGFVLLLSASLPIFLSVVSCCLGLFLRLVVRFYLLFLLRILLLVFRLVFR